MNYDTNNEKFSLAVELVNQSSRNIFIYIAELINSKGFSLIELILKDHRSGSIRVVKDKLGNAISYGEMRLVLAAI